MEFSVYKDEKNHDVVFRTIEVAECNDDVTKGGCPFNYDTMECRALTKAVGSHGIDVYSPDLDKCPLKEGQIIVKLRAG